jgi:Integral peroxisomal membrane peroxin
LDANAFHFRVGVIFVVQNKIADVLTWRNPIETISAMTIFSLVTLDPRLLLSLPFFILVFALLIPGYETRHPPPPNAISSAPAAVVQAYSPASQPGKPAAELSRGFFMNMRDIQNSMDDFSDLYDAIRKWVLDVTTFKDEPLSSTVLAFSFLASVALLLLIQFLPIRYFILIAGNALILFCHPAIKRWVVTNYITPQRIERLKKEIDEFVKDDYIAPPKPTDILTEVEIFESRRLQPPRPPNHFPDWSPSRYSTFPPQQANTTDKLSAVDPPPGYIFAPEFWMIDFDTEKWPRERAQMDESGYWIAEQDEFDQEEEGWVVYEAGGWKVRRMTRGVIRSVPEEEKEKS